MANPNPVLQTLLKARQLLNDEKRWTKYAMARTVTGAIVSAYDDAAESFCLSGAIKRSVPISPPGTRSHNLILSLVRQRVSGCLSIYGGSAVAFNDDPKTTPADIHRVLDKAIEKEKRDAKSK